MFYEKCNESKSMMKPRKENVRCEKQVVTIASVISVAESWLPATPHPGLSGAEFIVGFKREQVNSLSLDKMETGNPVTRLVADNGGRLGRSSDEAFVMRVEQRAWLVGVSIRQQLKAISGRLTTLKPNRNPYPILWIWVQSNGSFTTLRSSTRRAV